MKFEKSNVKGTVLSTTVPATAGIRFSTIFPLWITSMGISYFAGANWGGFASVSYCDINTLNHNLAAKATAAASTITDSTTSTTNSLTMTRSDEESTLYPGWKPIHIYYGKTLADGSDGEDMTKWAYSQVLQDRITMALLQDQRDMDNNNQVSSSSSSTSSSYFFVDLAANDAIQYSNTLTLEQNGWDGLCIEPNPIYWRRLATYRNCTSIAAIVGKNDLDQVEFRFDNNAWGGIVGYDNPDTAATTGKQRQQQRIEKHYTVSLSTLFTKFNVPKSIDYLSLDVEGAEELVIKSFPLDTYNFKVMTVERPQPGLIQLLQKHNYTQIATTSKWGETMWIHVPSITIPSTSLSMENYIDGIIKKVLIEVCQSASTLRHSMKPRAKRWLCSKYEL